MPERVWTESNKIESWEVALREQAQRAQEQHAQSYNNPVGWKRKLYPPFNCIYMVV